VPVFILVNRPSNVLITAKDAKDAEEVQGQERKNCDETQRSCSWTQRRISDSMVYRTANILLFATGCKLIWDGVSILRRLGLL